MCSSQCSLIGIRIITSKMCIVVRIYRFIFRLTQSTSERSNHPNIKKVEMQRRCVSFLLPLLFFFLSLFSCWPSPYCSGWFSGAVMVFLFFYVWFWKCAGGLSPPSISMSLFLRETVNEWWNFVAGSILWTIWSMCFLWKEISGGF